MCKLLLFALAFLNQYLLHLLSLPLDIYARSAPADAKHPISFPPCHRQAHWFARPHNNNWTRLVTTHVYCPIFDWDKLTNRFFPVTNCSSCCFRQLCSPTAASCRQGDTASAKNSRSAYDKLAKGKC
jgi:hypothetical protein